MEYTHIPPLSTKVSRIGLGTWSIGGALWGGTNENEAIDTLLSAFEKGINLVDTAPGYGNGVSEEIVGKAIKKYGNREKIVLATKCGLNLETKNVFRDSRKSFLQKEIENSLRRLQVDVIDIYQIHWPDPKTPLEETATFLKELLQQGKIKAIGVSNFSIEQMVEFQKYAPLHVLQAPFNIFENELADKTLPYCLKQGISILGYSSLCRGLLSGKMSKEREFKGDDLRKEMDPKFKEPQFSEYLKVANNLKVWAEQRKRPLSALAVRWVLDSQLSSALWGARKPEQLNDMDAALGWNLSPEDFQEVDQIVKNGLKHPVGPEFMAPPVRS